MATFGFRADSATMLILVAAMVALCASVLQICVAGTKIFGERVDADECIIRGVLERGERSVDKKFLTLNRIAARIWETKY